MRLICIWQQRKLARLMVLGEAVRPHSFLGRHLAACPNCDRARQEIVGLQSDVSLTAQPALSLDFDARLQARFQAQRRAALETAGQNTSSLQSARASAFPLRLGLAGTTFAALTLWYLWPAANLPRAATETAKRSSRQTPASPRKIELRRAVAFNAKQTAKRGVKPPAAPYRLIHSAALRFPSPLLAVRGEQRRRGGLVHRHPRRIFNVLAKARATQTMRHPGSQNTIQSPASSDMALLAPRVGFPLSWHKIGRVYEACGDFSHAAQAYGQAFANQPDADFALAASENAARAGDRGTSLEYFARALATEPERRQPDPADTNTNSDTKGNPK